LGVLERAELIEMVENKKDRRKKDIIETDLGTIPALWIP